jgi:pimeloyl-ACP methyl ester carboxylesterase
VGYLKVKGEGGTLFPKDRCVVSFDGTHIAYTLRGKGKPVIALCAGFCCPDNFWTYLVPALEKRYRVLIFNYRGAGVSGMPREPGYRARGVTVEDFAIDAYAKDLRAILDLEGIDEVVVLGHSMGVQVCFEAYRQMPERVKALIAVNGPYSSPLRTFYNTTLMPRLLPLGRVAVQAFPRPLLFAWKALLRKTSLPYQFAVRSGALGPKTKPEDMEPYFEHMAELDPLIVMKMAEAMHRHDAEALLREVKVPALIIVGDRDNFTPAWLGRVMASRIPVAELVVIEGGFHATIIEEPATVNAAVLDFLARHVGRGSGRKPASSRPSLRVVPGKEPRPSSAKRSKSKKHETATS